MRIAILLRAYDRPGGIGIYSRNIVKHMLRLDRSNHFLLVYSNRNHIGTYGELPNVKEIYVPPGNPVVWDQWSTRQALKRYRPDLIFNTKFSVPLTTGVDRVMALHGASWFVHPELYGKFDIMYVKATMPIYCRTARFLISNSDLTTRDFINIVGVHPSRIQTVHLAAGEEFRPLCDQEKLAQAREKYQLPQEFILTVTSYDPRKNFGTLIKALEIARRQRDIRLVVAGKDCHRYGEDFHLAERGLAEAVHFTGWMDQKDLPALYSLADAFVFPSIYEEFGIPVVEAMACGCPVLSSTTGAIPELVGDAGLLTDPMDAPALAENILKVTGSAGVAGEARRRGLARAGLFSWDLAAGKTLDIFTRLKEGFAAAPQVS
jgi:glycosyltransferase involved in cell wall biosynthesis